MTSLDDLLQAKLPNQWGVPSWDDDEKESPAEGARQPRDQEVRSTRQHLQELGADPRFIDEYARAMITKRPYAEIQQLEHRVALLVRKDAQQSQFKYDQAKSRRGQQSGEENLRNILGSEGDLVTSEGDWQHELEAQLLKLQNTPPPADPEDVQERADDVRYLQYSLRALYDRPKFEFRKLQRTQGSRSPGVLRARQRMQSLLEGKSHGR